MKEKFYFFSSFYETVKEIEDKELRLKYLEAIIEYGLNKKESDNPLIRALMAQTKFTLDRSEELSEQKSEKMKWNQNARKCFWTSKNSQNREKQSETDTNREKQTKTERNGVKQKKQEEEVEEEYIKKINKKKFWDFVMLTDEEYNKLLDILWEERLQLSIEKVNNYIGQNWKAYKSHYFTIRKRNEEFIASKNSKQANFSPPKIPELEPLLS